MTKKEANASDSLPSREQRICICPRVPARHRRYHPSMIINTTASVGGVSIRAPRAPTPVLRRCMRVRMYSTVQYQGSSCNLVHLGSSGVAVSGKLHEVAAAWEESASHHERHDGRQASSDLVLILLMTRHGRLCNQGSSQTRSHSLSHECLS